MSDDKPEIPVTEDEIAAQIKEWREQRLAEDRAFLAEFTAVRRLVQTKGFNLGEAQRYYAHESERAVALLKQSTSLIDVVDMSRFLNAAHAKEMELGKTLRDLHQPDPQIAFEDAAVKEDEKLKALLPELSPDDQSAVYTLFYIRIGEAARRVVREVQQLLLRKPMSAEEKALEEQEEREAAITIIRLRKQADGLDTPPKA